MSMFWRKDGADTWRNTRRQQVARVPPASGSFTEVDGPSPGTGRTVEAYLAFVRAEYDEMKAI
jgi:hypothetical protein